MKEVHTGTRSENPVAGSDPEAPLDLGINVVMVVTLIAGLAVTKIGAVRLTDVSPSQPAEPAQYQDRR
jgi:hypothetical protein